GLNQSCAAIGLRRERHTALYLLYPLPRRALRFRYAAAPPRNTADPAAPRRPLDLPPYTPKCPQTPNSAPPTRSPPSAPPSCPTPAARPTAGSGGHPARTPPRRPFR